MNVFYVSVLNANLELWKRSAASFCGRVPSVLEALKKKGLRPGQRRTGRRLRRGENLKKGSVKKERNGNWTGGQEEK